MHRFCYQHGCIKSGMHSSERVGQLLKQHQRVLLHKFYILDELEEDLVCKTLQGMLFLLVCLFACFLISDNFLHSLGL